MKVLHPNVPLKPNQKLAALLYRKRKEKGLTQKEVAQKVGCSPTYYTRIELGQRTLNDIAIATSISRVLSLPVNQVFELILEDYQEIGNISNIVTIPKGVGTEQNTFILEMIDIIAKTNPSAKTLESCKRYMEFVISEETK